MSEVAIRLGEKMKKRRSPMGLIFDGWSDGRSTHYCAIFSEYLDENNLAVTELLASSPFQDEADYSSDAYKNFIEETLACYGLILRDIDWLTGDNANVNLHLADLCEKPILGCDSHRLNLAAKILYRKHEELLQKVETLMGKLRTLKGAAALRSLTSLVAHKRNLTRWSSTFKMVNRFLELLPHLRALAANDAEIEELMLSTNEAKKMSQLRDELGVIESISLQLQSQDCTKLQSRILFDTLRANIVDPALKVEVDHYLSPTGSIVHDPAFESGLVKLQKKQSSQLNDEERAAMHPFLIPPRPCIAVDGGGADAGGVPGAAVAAGAATSEEVASAAVGGPRVLAPLFLRRIHPPSEGVPVVAEKITGNKRGWAQMALEAATQALAAQEEYIDTSFISPTSNIVERLFSKAKLTYSDLRSRMTPEHLEQLLFLRVNKSYWDCELIMQTLAKLHASGRADAAPDA